MCGITVVVGNLGQSRSLRKTIQQMTDVLVHRGPNAEGTHIIDGPTPVGLGHRRLSIVDLQRGQQPMCNEDGTVWITYNGEIYNHQELRAELEARGHRYKTSSDTETVIHAYEEWGTDAVHRFQGMFAFAIWDDSAKRLFAARDRLGIKPFYYAVGDQLLICASEIKAILASGLHDASLRAESVPEMVTFGYLAGEETLLSGVKKLLPGHWLTWCKGQCRTQQYWDVPLPCPETDKQQSDQEWVREFRSRFDESVRKRLMSDVPLGVFLSGGIDSSAIAATMARQMAEPLKTFSVGFETGYYSEFNYAREVASALNTDHHETILSADDTFGFLPQMIWHEEEPLRSAASTALHWVSKLARKHVTVVLTGEGSDELYGGYARYWATLFNQKWGRYYNWLVPEYLRDRWIRPNLWRGPLPYSVKRKLSHTFLNHEMCPEEILFDNFYAIFSRRSHNRLFTRRMQDEVKAVDPYLVNTRLYKERNSGNQLDRLLYVDQKTYLVDLLTKQDAMSMAASVESRVPFLDHQMVEFAAQVPQRLKLGKLGGKHIVKLAFRDLLPPSILSREKMGFPVPVRQWLSQGYDKVVRNVLLSERARDRDIFNTDYVAALLSEHARHIHDHTDRLWSLLNFELWARIYIDDQGYETTQDEMAAVLADRKSNYVTSSK